VRNAGVRGMMRDLRLEDLYLYFISNQILICGVSLTLGASNHKNSEVYVIL